MNRTFNFSYTYIISKPDILRFSNPILSTIYYPKNIDKHSQLANSIGISTQS